MAATDTVLLNRWIACRDAEAFSELVSRHADLVHGVCRRIVRNAADAEDVAQECFIKLAAMAAAPRTSLAGWLHAVASRSSIDLLRAGARRRSREQRAASMCTGAGRGDPGWAELQELVDVCLAELPASLRDVLVAHFLQRRTHEAVAESLGVSRQTVTHRIAQGIERLRARLARRGIPVAGAALGTFLGGLPGEAAPASLAASLGRLALAGMPAARAAGVVAAIPGVIVAKKIVISAVVAVVLFLAVGFAVLQGRAGRSAPAPVLASRSVPPAARRDSTSAAVPGSTPAAVVGPRSPAALVSADVPARGGWRGVVVDAAGSPVPGARVALAATGGERATILHETIAGAAGSFVLDAPDAAASLDGAGAWAFKPGSGVGFAALDAAGIEIALVPLAAASGRIHDRDTGEGIAGLAVRLAPAGRSRDTAAIHAGAWTVFQELRPGVQVALTGDDGRYALADLAPVRLVFIFDPNGSGYVLPGYRLRDALPDLTLSPGEVRADVDFALHRGGGIAGKVLGPDGRAVPGAAVEALAPHLMHFPRRLAADAEGAYRFIGLAPMATYVITAARDGLAPGESAPIALSSVESMEGVDIRLARGTTVRGRVVDGDGRPLAGIAVQLVKLRGDDHRHAPRAGTVTGKDGSFAFEPVAPGEHALAAVSERHLPAEQFAFTAREDGDVTGIELVLRAPAPGFISGRVVDSTGAAVGGFPVNAMAGSKRVGGARSGDDGSFRIDGLGDAETYTIIGYSGEYWSGRQLAVDLYSTDVTLVVMRRGRIAGRVVQAESGEPVQHFEARAVFIRAEPDGGENRFHLLWTPFDSPAGEFSIERAEPVDCEVQVRAPGYIEARSARFAIPPGGVGEVVVALSAGATVRGVVVDALSGEPLPGALVRAHQQEDFSAGLFQEGTPSYASRGVWERTMAGADGTFQLPGMAAGESVHLAVWKQGYGPAVRAGVVVENGDAPLRIPLAPAASLRLALRSRGAAVGRHEVVAYHRAEKPWRAAFRAGAELPAAAGTAELSRLPAGPYRVAPYAVETADGLSGRRLLGEERIELAPGESRELAIDPGELADRFATATGTVRGAVDPSRVRLFIVSDDDPDEPYAQAPAAPAAGGAFAFTGLVPGRYTLWVSSGTGGAAVRRSFPVLVKGVERVEVAVELP